MGRALYREGGPSQDGDPVPGDLPFFVWFFFKPFFMIFVLFVCFPMVYLVLNTLDAFLFSFKILFQTPKDKGVSWKLNNLFESVHKIKKNHTQNCDVFATDWLFVLIYIQEKFQLHLIWNCRRPRQDVRRGRSSPICLCQKKMEGNAELLYWTSGN